jgi:hypothetical protein
VLVFSFTLQLRININGKLKIKWIQKIKPMTIEDRLYIYDLTKRFIVSSHHFKLWRH